MAQKQTMLAMYVVTLRLHADACGGGLRGCFHLQVMVYALCWKPSSQIMAHTLIITRPHNSIGLLLDVPACRVPLQNRGESHITVSFSV